MSSSIDTVPRILFVDPQASSSCGCGTSFSI